MAWVEVEADAEPWVFIAGTIGLAARAIIFPADSLLVLPHDHLTCFSASSPTC
jgi:hypothetical protein